MKKIRIHKKISSRKIVITAFIILTVFLLLYSIDWYKIAERYSIIPKKEHYTELYFNNHLLLPQYLPAEKVATASFTIRNREQTNKDYQFIISKILDNNTNVVGSGTAELSPGEAKNIDFEFTVATTESKTKIQVDLPTQKQSIHFWVNQH